jgi:hypothetical protein
LDELPWTPSRLQSISVDEDFVTGCERAVRMSELKVAADLIVLMPVYEDRKSATKLVQQLSEQLSGRCYVIVMEDGSVADPM